VHAGQPRKLGVLGADAAGLPSAVVAGVAEYGMEFGISLQLIDDLIDITSTPQLAGKPVGVDFVAGTVTVPAALAMHHLPELRSLLRPDLDDLARRRALALLRSPESVWPSMVAAVGHAVAAGDRSGGAAGAVANSISAVSARR